MKKVTRAKWARSMCCVSRLLENILNSVNLYIFNGYIYSYDNMFIGFYIKLNSRYRSNSFKLLSDSFIPFNSTKRKIILWADRTVRGQAYANGLWTLDMHIKYDYCHCTCNWGMSCPFVCSLLIVFLRETGEGFSTTFFL